MTKVSYINQAAKSWHKRRQKHDGIRERRGSLSREVMEELRKAFEASVANWTPSQKRAVREEMERRWPKEFKS